MEIPTEQPDGSEACVMPPEYEEYMLRKVLWQEAGLHYEDTPLEVTKEHMTFRSLEAEHPYRQQKAQRAAQQKLGN